jgi:hypothetical protein
VAFQKLNKRVFRRPNADEKRFRSSRRNEEPTADAGTGPREQQQQIRALRPVAVPWRRKKKPAYERRLMRHWLLDQNAQQLGNAPGEPVFPTPGGLTAFQTKSLNQAGGTGREVPQLAGDHGLLGSRSLHSSLLEVSDLLLPVTTAADLLVTFDRHRHSHPVWRSTKIKVRFGVQQSRLRARLSESRLL